MTRRDPIAHRPRVHGPAPRTRRRRRVRALAVVTATAIGVVLGAEPAPPARAPLPVGVLVPAQEQRLPGPVDSNSPVVWTTHGGQASVHVFTSFAGATSRASATSVDALPPATPIGWLGAAPPGGVWLEAIVADAGGTWYGVYHNEVAPPDCPGSAKVEPRIGMATSVDEGASWRDLGVVLAAPPGTATCASRNKYFVGGVGDVSVALDADQQYLYFFYSQYLPAPSDQGVTVARMAWASRDEPAGAVSVWREGIWLPSTHVPHGAGEPSDAEGGTWVHAAASPVFQTTDSWHDGTTANAFWGPSVHWNTHLRRYVMLLNKSRSVDFDQEGVYAATTDQLDDPDAWSTPRRLLAGGRWYPQVIGLEPGTGTDKVAGRTARFFMGGRSDHLIEF